MKKKTIQLSTLSTEMPENWQEVTLNLVEEQVWSKQDSDHQMILTNSLIMFLGMPWHQFSLEKLLMIFCQKLTKLQFFIPNLKI